MSAPQSPQLLARLPDGSPQFRQCVGSVKPIPYSRKEISDSLSRWYSAECRVSGPHPFPSQYFSRLEFDSSRYHPTCKVWEGGIDVMTIEVGNLKPQPAQNCPLDRGVPHSGQKFKTEAPPCEKSRHLSSWGV